VTALAPDYATNRLLAEWTRRYRPALASYFRKRLRAPGEAEDLVQEVFLRLARQHDLSAIRLIEPYLFQTASRVLTDYLRAGVVRHAGKHDSFEEEAHSGGVSSLEAVIADRQSVDRLLQALAELPERTQMIFVLRRWDGLANADIARMVGISVSAVEKHITKALVHLKARIDD
jgi:RNA polymerase sigma-70 factor (ECF subfamily)